MFFGGKYQLKRRPREMYKYILMCAAASAVCLCVCCIIPHQHQGFSVMILKRSIDAPAVAVYHYIVCAPACSSLSSSCLMVISNSGGTAAVKRTLTSAFIHMFERRHQKTLSTNFCCLRQNIKKGQAKSCC